MHVPLQKDAVNHTPGQYFQNTGLASIEETCHDVKSILKVRLSLVGEGDAQ